jgi:hypothetical protein
MGNLDIAKTLVGKRSKVFKKVDPADLKSKMRGTWYLKTFIEKFFFIFGAIASACFVVWGIGKLAQVLGG